MDKPNSPGCALAVIRDGSVVYKRGYGTANLGQDVPITPSTVFHAASISKGFTAAAIVLLAHQGKLSLDDEVHKYVPELAGFGTPLTVRHLIHHTSGLRDQVPLLGLAGWRIYLDLVTRDDVLEVVSRQRELNFRPGEKNEYSNTNYTLLAMIVERVSGQSFREFTRAKIFQPLGMKTTHFHDDHAEIVKHQAYGYAPGSGGTFRLSNPNTEEVGPTGLLTTVEDLALWDRNFYDGRLGGSALIEQLHERGKLDNGKQLDYAYGLVIGTYRGLPIVEHSGGIAGYQADLIRFPGQRFSVACLCNTTANPIGLTRKVADIYLAAELNEPASSAATEETVQLSEAQLSSKVGLYWDRDSDRVRKVSLKQGKLQWVSSDGTHEMLPLSQDRFRLAGQPIELRFESATSGRPDLAEMFRGGEPTFFKPVEEFAPTRAELREHVGTYFSGEAEAVYRVSLQDDKLVLNRPRRKAVMLEPTVRDVFTMPGWTIRFARDSNDRISEMLFNRYAIRNFRFTKQAVPVRRSP